MADWQINKTLGQCYGTENQFEPGQECFSALVETDDGFERRDYSIDFWTEQKPQTYCFWKTKMPAEGQKRQMFIDDEMLMSFFDRLEEETDEDKINFRFVLTLVLMRKRKLKYLTEKIEDGKEFWQLKVTAQDRTANVLNPHINEEKIEQLTAQMGQIMQVDV